MKGLLEDRKLDKVTVVDIVEDCEVNRQTFYYHFKDIYDLVEWIFTSETMKLLDGNKSYATWQEGYLRAFEYARKNRNFMVNVYYSTGREYLMNFLYRETYELLMGVIEEKAQEEQVQVQEEDKAFIADFCKYGFVGLVMEWLRSGMKEDPKWIVKRLGCLIQGDISKAIEKFRELDGTGA